AVQRNATAGRTAATIAVDGQVANAELLLATVAIGTRQRREIGDGDDGTTGAARRLQDRFVVALADQICARLDQDVADVGPSLQKDKPTSINGSLEVRRISRGYPSRCWCRNGSLDFVIYNVCNTEKVIEDSAPAVVV